MKQVCQNCLHLTIKDFVFGICVKTGALKQPDDTCDKWTKDIKTPERDFYQC